MPGAFHAPDQWPCPWRSCYEFTGDPAVPGRVRRKMALVELCSLLGWVSRTRLQRGSLK